MLRFTIALAAAMTALPAGAATVKSKIDVTFVGLPIGQMIATTKADGASYSYAGKVKSNALVRMVSGTTVSFSGSGAVAGNRAIPSKHSTIYKQRRETGEVHLAFANGSVTQTRSIPAVKYKEGSVPVLPAHLQNVLDPASALVFPVEPAAIGDGKAVCNRTLPVFDGKTRVNLKLSHAGSTAAQAKGFDGTVHTCAVRYEPVSGHRPAKENVKYWTANRDITVTMAQIGNAPVYGLFGFDIKTDKGWARGTASMFDAR